MANANMNTLIDVINRLQDHVSKAGMPPMAFDLPQIVVVGSQSAGKSSVLENFVGEEFLPRGAGIVTRRPLVLQMVYDANNKYGEFSHGKRNPPRKYQNFADIRKEIEVETERTAPGKAVSATPINLKIYSPNVINLTLVDLPGLTLIATADQPADIEKQIYDIVGQYAKQSNALILAVSPANVDLANSAALKLAKEVDPLGERTISVIPKIDLMAADTDARSILANKLIKLKHGHWGVINSSREKERKFFDDHVAYRQLDIAKQCSTPKLQAALVEQLSNHIRHCLPKLREDLRRQLALMSPEIDELRQLEAANINNALLGKYRVLNGIMQYLASAFEQSIEAISGTPTTGSSGLVSTTALECGARIYKLFSVKFQNDLAYLCNDDDDDELECNAVEQEIATAIRNSNGIRSVVFPHQKAFETVTSKRIERLHDPCERCVDDVSQELRTTFGRIINASQSGCSISRYPALRNEIERRFESCLSMREDAVKKYIHEHIECQRTYLNTNHKDFVKIDEIVEERQEIMRCQKTAAAASTRAVHSTLVTAGGSRVSMDNEALQEGGGGAIVSNKYISSRRRQAVRKNNDSPRMAQHIIEVYIMIRSYLSIAHGDLCFNVPNYIVKQLTYEVIKYLKKDLPSELQAAVTKEHYSKKRKIADSNSGGGGAASGAKRKGRAAKAAGSSKEVAVNNDEDIESDAYEGANLMEETAEVIEQRKEALRVYEATRKALRIAETTLSAYGQV